MTHGNQHVEITEWSRMDDINTFVNSLLRNKAYAIATGAAFARAKHKSEIESLTPGGICSSFAPDWITQQERDGLR